MKKVKAKYPGTNTAQNTLKQFDFIIDCEPDIIETSSGYCPNYEKFDRCNISIERALQLCNMD